PPSPTVSAVAGCAAPAPPAGCGSPGAAGRDVGPGGGLGSSVRRRSDVGACSHSLGAIVTVTFANRLRRSVKHGIKSQFLCSIEAPFLRPDLGSGERRAQPQSRLARPKGGPPPEAARS